MIDYSKYNLDNDDLEFICTLKNDVVNQNEIRLQYKGISFVLQPSGDEILVYAHNCVLERYKSFDDLLLRHKINDVAMIDLIPELDFAD